MRDCDGVEHFGIQRIGPELRRHRLHRACRVDEVRHQYDTAKIEIVRARSRESDVRFYEKLRDAGREVDFLVVPRAMHVWERFCEKGTVFWDLKEDAFRRTVARIRSGHSAGAADIKSSENVDVSDPAK